MSQDRRPGRVRVTKAGADAPQRRRHDAAPVVVDGNLPPIARTAPPAGKARLVLPLLFLACAGVGGVTMAVLGFA